MAAYAALTNERYRRAPCGQVVAAKAVNHGGHAVGLDFVHAEAFGCSQVEALLGWVAGLARCHSGLGRVVAFHAALFGKDALLVLLR